MTGEFDFVIVGAGSAGCALASRLTQDDRNSVALLEAGPRDRSIWLHLPIGYGKTMWDPKVNWGFYTEPDPNMNGRNLYWPRGKVLGGSSSINGLIYIRGQRQDYDHWAALGNTGWGWNEVLPYFIKLESDPDLAADQLHGTSGPMKISSIKRPHPLIEAVIAAAERLGIPRTRDFNGATQEGAGYYQLTTYNGWRVSAARAYLAPARRRKNLSVIPEAHVTRVLLEDRRAAGVAFRKAGRHHELKARRGVVLAAGALQSPQLLMLSGIGPGAMLTRLSLPVIVDRPAVGQNLQDHLQVRLIYRLNRPLSTNDQLRSLLGRSRLAFEWLAYRGGALAVGINQGGIFTRVLDGSQTPDIQFHVATLSADMAGGKVHEFSGMTLSVCQLRPESRGHIELASADPMAPPRMHPNYLSAETDRRCTVRAIKLARRLAATKPLADLIESEFRPGPEAESQDDFLEFARNRGQTIFHPSGTCRMGVDADAVVDPRLRVRGVERLWVADCSIMPRLISGNTNIPAIMIGEKASDMIREDARLH